MDVKGFFVLDAILGGLIGAVLHYGMYNLTYWQKIGIPQGDIYPGIPVGYDTVINLAITGTGALLLPGRAKNIFAFAFWFLVFYQLAAKLVDMGIGAPAAGA